MSQLSLFDVAKEWVDPSKVLGKFEPYNRILCQWTTEYETRDDEYQPLLFRVTVRCREAVVQRRIKGKKRDVPGYIVEVLERLKDAGGRIISEGVSYGRSFLQKDRKEAIREYTSCVAGVHFQWRVIGESRARVVKEAGESEDWYECPFCGYMALEFFETCQGCGKRFVGLEVEI